MRTDLIYEDLMYPDGMDLMGLYLKQVAEDGRSMSTVRTYGDVIENWTAFLTGRRKTPLQATTDDLRSFAVRPRPRKGGASAAPASRRKDITIVRLWHQWAFEEGYGFPTFRSVRAPKVPTHTPRPILDDHWRALWNGRLKIDDRLWLGLGYFGGLRRVEIVTCGPEAVDNPQQGLMQFERKGGNYYPIELAEAVDSYKAELPWLCEGVDEWYKILRSQAEYRLGIGANFLWWDAAGTPEADANRLNKRLIRLVRARGLPDGSITPHRLRHSCATNLLRAGWPVDEVRMYLSHGSVDITHRYASYAGQTARRKSRERKNHGATE